MKQYYVAAGEAGAHLTFRLSKAKTLAGAKRAALRLVYFQGVYAHVAADEAGEEILCSQIPDRQPFGGFGRGVWVERF